MRLFRVAGAIAIAIGVTGCASAIDPNTLSDDVKANSPLAFPHYKEQRQKEIDQANAAAPSKLASFANCVDLALPKIDDGISDAKTIALGATNYCQAQYESYLQVAAVPLSPQAVQQRFVFDMNTEAKRTAMSLNAVLRYRAAKKSG